jgi:anti-sigma-K factor RskA
MSADQHVDDLIAAYALDCLDEDDVIWVSKHLANCVRCQAELNAYWQVVDQLPLTVQRRQPSPQLKEKLMAQVHRMQADTGRESEDFWQRFRGLLSQTAPVWSLASLVIIVLLITSNLLLWQQVRGMREQSRADTMRVVAMDHTQVAPGATGLIVISLDGEHGTLVVDHLPFLSAENQYQLWLINNGERASGGVFSVSKDGYGSVWVNSPQPLADYSAFGVTIEPAGGSPGPTGEKVLGGDL